MGKKPARKILLCGHRAFSARGLADLLSLKGHDVIQFSRGELRGENKTVYGDVCQIDENPLLDNNFDTVINFIVLGHESIEKNLAYIQSLLRLCEDKSVRHLIHISSLSVYPDSLMVISENGKIKTEPEKCGAYAGIKVATDLYLLKHFPAGIKLSLIRPAYIIASDISNPVGSIAMTIFKKYLLILSREDRVRPLITRTKMQQAISRLVESPPIEQKEILLFVDPDSPSHLDYLNVCSTIDGTQKVISLPAFFWVPIYFVNEIKRSKQNRFLFKRFLRSALSRMQQQKYDPAWTEERLGLSLHSDWQAALRG